MVHNRSWQMTCRVWLLIPSLIYPMPEPGLCSPRNAFQIPVAVFDTISQNPLDSSRHINSLSYCVAALHNELVVLCNELVVLWVNPLELSQLFVNISESSAVWPRLRPNWDMLIFFGVAPVLFILNYYKVHLFYSELNSLHRGFKIITYSISKLTIFVSELGKFSPQHRDGLDAGDSVDLTSTVHIVWS